MKSGLKIISFIVCICLAVSVVCVPVSASTGYTGREDFLWGVNIHPTSYPDYGLDPELYVKASAELGVDTIRVNIGANLYDFSYVDRIVALCSSYNLKIIACVALSDDLDYNRNYYETLCSRYDGKSGYGFIDYYEIGGEEEIRLLNNKYPNGGGPNGDSMDHYYESDVITLMNKFASAIEGVKNSGTAAKTIIDFSHLHYAPLLYMYQNGLDFDIVGIDWYTNMGSLKQVLNPVLEKFPHDIMITETNLWSSSETDFTDISEYDMLFDFMDLAYATDRVKGLLFYELVDEPVFESSGSFNTESHFGLLYSLNETSVTPKPIYTHLQSLLGGGSVTPEPVLYKEVRALLDLDGTHKTFADASYWYYYYLGDWHMKENLSDADFSDSQFVELDIKIGDYEAFKNAIDTYGLSLWFRLSSGVNRHSNSTAAQFSLDDLISLGNGWYHLKLPITSFTRNENGDISWNSIKNWAFFIEGDKHTVDNIYSMEFYFRNICGTSPVGSILYNAIAVLDEQGCFNTIGSYYNDIYARFNKLGFNAVDLSSAEFIEFDMQFSDYDKLIEAINKTGVRMDFGVTSSGELWRTRWVALNVFNYCEYSGYGWYHFKIPKINFGNSGGGGTIDWSNVNTWVITFGNSSGITTDEYCGITMNIKNICGTVYRLVSDVYTVSDGYVTVQPGTDVAELSKAFLCGAVYNGGQSIESGVAVTDMTVAISVNGKIYDSATVVVRDDICPDGYVNSTDLVLLKKYLFESVNFTPSQKFALTGSVAGEPTILDFIRMKNKLQNIV